MIGSGLLGIVLVLAILAGNRLVHGRPVGFNPLVALMATWATSVFLYLVNPFGLISLQKDTWFLIGGGLAAFTFGYWLTWFVANTLVTVPNHVSLPELKQGGQAWRPIQLLWRCSMVWFCGFFALFLLNALRRYGANPLTLLQRLRLDIGETGAPIGFYYFYAAQLIVPLGLLMWRHGRPRQAGYLWASGAALASLWFTTGRTNLTIAITWVLAAFLFEWGRRRVRPRVIVVSLFAAASVLVLFALMGDAIGKTYANSALSDADRGFVPRSLVLPYLYEVASLPVLDQAIFGNSAPGGGDIPPGYLFRPVYQIGSLLGLDVTVPENNLPYWRTPYWFNTATFFAPLVSAFGQGWTFVCLFLFGGMSAAVYLRWLLRPSLGALLLASLCIAALVQSTLALRVMELSFWVEACALLAVMSAEKRESLRQPHVLDDAVKAHSVSRSLTPSSLDTNFAREETDRS